MWIDLSAYGMLFAGAFGAASILPFYSEPILIGMLLLERYDPLALLIVASTGNTAGAILNWWLARYTLHWHDKPWFPVSQRRLVQASTWFQRYGVWTLLLAWAPIGGDALTFVAGLLRVPLGRFILLVGSGKTARYAFVIWTTQTAMG